MTPLIGDGPAFRLFENPWLISQNLPILKVQLCIILRLTQYREDLWGLTASYSIDGYVAHRPFEVDYGVISPTASVSSIPYTPDESMQVIRNLYEIHKGQTFGPYGFYDALSFEHNWFPQRYLAIDQGPMIVMIENHRSGLL